MVLTCSLTNRAGREGIAPDRLLRCIVLKHVKGWSYRELQRELRASLLYRRFTRFYEDPIPDFSNLCQAFALFGKEGTEQIHQQIVQQAIEASIIGWRRISGKCLLGDWAARIPPKQLNLKSEVSAMK